MRRAKLRSLAKINLDLRVLHKSADGFHELRTVFQTISLADRIEMEYEPATKTALSLDDALEIPDNLVLRAARSVLDALKVKAQVRFKLSKNIPMGGGFGGGSSNAAAVLLALPALAGKALPMSRLMEIGAGLGSDVPFFLLGGTALGLGRGTELYPLEDLRPEHLLLVAPGVHVATGPAYQALGRGLTFEGASSSINTFQAYVRALGEVRSAGRASTFSANDFEAVVTNQFPQLKTIQGRLRKLGATGVRMTGSGSGIFGIFGSAAERDHAQGILAGDRVFGKYTVVPAVLVNRSGYRRMWRRQLQQHLNVEDSAWPPRSRYEK